MYIRNVNIHTGKQQIMSICRYFSVVKFHSKLVVKFHFEESPLKETAEHYFDKAVRHANPLTVAPAN